MVDTVQSTQVPAQAPATPATQAPVTQPAPATATAPVTTQQTLTPEQEIASLKTKLAETEKGLRTAHQTLTQKDQELKRKTDLEEKVASLENIVKLSTAFMFENQGKDPNAFQQAKEQRPEDLKKQFDAVVAQSEAKRKIENQRQDVITKISSIQTRTESLGLTDESDDYLEIKNLAVMATPESLKLAERKLAKLESAKGVNTVTSNPQVIPAPPVPAPTTTQGVTTQETKTVENTETEDQRIERKAREMLIQQGLLRPEPKQVSGVGTLTPEMVSRMTPDERWARRKEIDAMPIELPYTTTKR